MTRFAVDRSPRGLVVASGPDATAFLQSLLSQDLDPVVDGEHAPALLLTPQGKLDVALRALRVGDEWWLDTDAEYGPRLAAALGRFRIRVQVDLEDRTPTTGLASVVGVEAANDLSGGGVDVTGGAAQPDRAHAPARGQRGGQPLLVVIAGGALKQLDVQGLGSRSRPVIDQDRDLRQCRAAHAAGPCLPPAGSGASVPA